MSSSNTIDYFKDKNPQEIINWMIANLSEDEIKTCLNDSKNIIEPSPIIPEPVPSPTIPPPPPTTPVQTKSPLFDIRKLCENKRYVIEKIIDDKVNFWYYSPNREEWLYNIDFDINKFETGNECGDDTLIEDSYRQDLIEAYRDNDVDKNKDKFEQVKKEYYEKSININWITTLEKAIQIQRSLKDYVKNKNYTTFKNLNIEYPPILIEGVTKNNKVSYYYLLINKQNELEWTHAYIHIDKFEQDVKEIVDELKDIDSLKDKKEIYKKLRELLSNEPKDFYRIRKIYNKYPISSTDELIYFSDDVLSPIEKTTNFGKLSNMTYNNIEHIIRKKYGIAFLKRYKPKKITTKNGIKTVVYVKRNKGIF